MKKYLRLILLIIALLTLLTGLTQMLAPQFILNLIGVEINPTIKLLFAIVGMFMFLFGGIIGHALYNEDQSRVALFWSGIQKFGASVAVFLAVAQGVFTSITLAVSAFDLLTSVLIFVYLRTMK